MIALFLVVTGGTAYALDGSNTVFSDDIVNQEVKTADIGTGEVRSADIGTDQVLTADIGPNQVRGIDVNESTLRGIPAGALGLGQLSANTVELQDAPGGGSDSAQLFSIGRVPLLAICSASAGGELSALIATAETVDGPVLVVGDDSLVLIHDSVDFVLGVTNTVVKAKERSFAIFDRGFGSASGVAAVSIDPATGGCVISAHALG